MCPAEGPAVGTALAARIDHPGHRIPGHGKSTTVGRAKSGVFLRLGDHRPDQGDVEPRRVAVDRVAPVLAARRQTTEILQPDSAGRAGV